MTRALKVLSLCVLLNAAIVSRADTPGSPHITVILRYPAGLPDTSIASAERPAARIFDKAGVILQWRNCPENDGRFPDQSCEGPFTPSDLVVHIVPSAQKAANAVFGVAFLNTDGGVYADVFLGRVQAMRDQYPKISFASLLGCVIAHEIGHLLLGEHSHSNTGLMQAQWQFEQLQKIAMGSLLFNSREAAKLRVRAAALSDRATRASLAFDPGN